MMEGLYVAAIAWCPITPPPGFPTQKEWLGDMVQLRPPDRTAEAGQEFGNNLGTKPVKKALFSGGRDCERARQANKLASWFC